MRTARSSLPLRRCRARLDRRRRCADVLRAGGQHAVARAPSAEDACADITTVTDGTLTVGTSDPAFPPYVIDNDPTNGKGFESAVAYAVAEEMGFTADQVDWTFAGLQQALRTRREGLRLRAQPDLASPLSASRP